MHEPPAACRQARCNRDNRRLFGEISTDRGQRNGENTVTVTLPWLSSFWEDFVANWGWKSGQSAWIFHVISR